MTISTETMKVTYEGNGSNTTFDFAFLIPEAESVLLTYTDANGIESVIESSDYTLTGINNPSGGTVTYPLSGSPLAAGTFLTISRNMSYTQEVSLSNQGNMYPIAVEQGLDRTTMMIQQLVDRLNRALVFSITDTAIGNLPAAAARAQKFMAFDANGQPTVAAGTSADLTPVSVFVNTLLSAADASTFRGLIGAGTDIGTGLNGTIFGNISGSTAAGTFSTIESYLAHIIATRGAMLRVGASGWEGIGLGSNGTFVGSNGTDLTYLAPPVGERSFSNLVVNATTTTAATITADWLTVTDSINIPRLLRSVSLTLNTGASGANGLDTGVLANSTWYAVWVIYNPTTAVTACLISTSATSPTMPSGYTQKARVGWLLTNGSAQLVGTIQRGRKVQYKTSQVAATGASGNVTTPTWTAIGTSGLVPSTAAEIVLYPYTNSIAGVVIAAANNGYGGISSAANPPQIAARFVNATYDNLTVAQTSLVLESSNIYYACSAGGSLFCAGWIDNL
jgi:hypothetical protein